MLETVAVSLLSTFISFVFQLELEDTFSAKLKSLPRWYHTQVSGQVCESGMAPGPMPASHDAAVADARARLAKRVQLAQSAAATEHVKLRRGDAAEQALVTQFASDVAVADIVARAALRDQALKRKPEEGAYVRLCIAQPQIEQWQRARLAQLVVEVSHVRRGRAEAKLDAATGAGARDPAGTMTDDHGRETR